MRDYDAMNISAILTHLDNVLRKYMDVKVYASTLPNTLKTTDEGMVVIDCGNAISDFHAYGSGIVNIFLYARPTQNGQMNVPKLSQMEKAFNKAIRENAFDNDHYIVQRELPISRSDYDGTYNMHFVFKSIRLLIL